MDLAKLESFLARFKDFSRWDPRKQVDYLAFFLVEETGQAEFKSKDIDACFELASLKKYSRLPVYLSEQAGNRGGKYVKIPKGYTLERGIREAIHRHIQGEPENIRVTDALLELLGKITDPNERSFLQEALDCYRVRAFRATIVMIWALTVHHLREHVLRDKLAEFNSALAKNTDKRIRISAVKSTDDFNEIPDDKFIDFSRNGGIISNDVKKILGEKLGIRNSAAHPSGVHFASHKATEFALDLLNNVILKY